MTPYIPYRIYGPPSKGGGEQKMSAYTKTISTWRQDAVRRVRHLYVNPL